MSMKHHRKQNCKTGMIPSDHLVHCLSDFLKTDLFPQRKFCIESRLRKQKEIVYRAQIEKAMKSRAVVVKIEVEAQVFLEAV